MEEKTKIKNTVDISTEQGVPIIPVASSNEVMASPTVDIDAEETLKSPYGETNNTLRSVRVRACLKNIKQDLLSTYSKRNPVVNALLSIFFVGSIILSLFMLLSSIVTILCYFDIGWVWCYGAAMMFYPLFCIYFMYRFIVGNHKNAVIPALMGNAVVQLIEILQLSYANTSELPDDEECDFLLNLILLLVIAAVLLALLCAISFSFIYLIMKMKKYGASAWALLEVSRGGRTVFEKINIVVFSVIWLLPIAASAYDDYKVKHPTDKDPSHKSAKIGDYYYSDGTISSNLLTNKCAVGMVFSLETSVEDSIRGYTHGQIVSLSDIRPNRMQWDSDMTDYNLYPNYTWNNRMDAINDISGLKYTNCEGYDCLQINWDSMKYMESEIEGTSIWYVPTAGQWAKILENLGGVKIDNMLKFDRTTASKNLEKINPHRYYWTITEFDAENAWSIRLLNGEFGSRSN